MRLGQSTFKPSASIDAWRRVRLEMNVVATVWMPMCPKEMIKADLHHCRCGQIRGDVSANSRPTVVRLEHHGDCIPTQDALDAGL